MANNTTLNTGTGGDVIRDIDRAGVKTQVAQIDMGGAAAEVLLVAGQTTMSASVPVTLASNQTTVPVNANPTRVNVAMTCYQAAGIITTEALFAAATFAISRDGAAASTGVQLAVTTGKKFRITSIVVSIKNTAAAAGTSKLVLRYAAAGGTIATTSPILVMMDLGSNSAVAAAYIGPTEMQFPDGVDLLALSTFGFTVLSSAVTMLHTITLNGYEY
jgi:hypothetical protein